MGSGFYRIASFGQQKGGASGSFAVTIYGIAKPNSPGAPYCIPNEYICGTIGRFIGLPIPPVAIMHTPQHNQHHHWCASLDFNHTGNDLPPVDPKACVAALPDLSTGLLLFDILVANGDRHQNNFNVDFGSHPAKMSVFDHSHALFGFQVGQGMNRLNTLRDRLGMSGGSRTGGARHCLIDHISTDQYFSKWQGRIKALPDYLIEEACEEVIGIGIDATESRAACTFLKHRRDNLYQIIDSNRGEFKGILQWSLFP